MCALQTPLSRESRKQTVFSEYRARVEGDVPTCALLCKSSMYVKYNAVLAVTLPIVEQLNALGTNLVRHIIITRFLRHILRSFAMKSLI
jgi:hypothetical protein